MCSLAERTAEGDSEGWCEGIREENLEAGERESEGEGSCSGFGRCLLGASS